MNAQDFCYWLTGFTEPTQGQTPNPAQWKSICEHLDLVFKKVTPPVESMLPSTASEWAEYLKKHPLTTQTTGLVIPTHPGVTIC